MINKLLYLTYIPLREAPTSGSSVRPQKMKEALEKMNVEVRTFGGISNNIQIRRRTVAEIKDLLRLWRPDACYIEPPSGPLFYYGDVRLIKRLHQMDIPISIFYRDAYWKYPEYSTENKLSAVEKIKRLIIKTMQVHQWNVFRKNIDIIYFPSMTMANEFNCPRKDTLPPGGFIPDVKRKTELSKPLQYIFVGGAARNHGTFLTIEAFERANKSGIIAKLIYICPETQWQGLGIDQEKYRDWLDVVHTSGDENLKLYYEQSDIALLTAPRTAYRDFAVPIKIFEYISYLKPILVTDSTETARIINDNHVGWVVNSTSEAVAEKIKELSTNPSEIVKIRNHMGEARSSNLWTSRSEKVLSDLNEIKNWDKNTEGA